MKFSAQEEYGLRCLLQLARVPAGSSLTIPEMSRREGLSQTHMAKLLMTLRKEGFIQSTRGQLGGYVLARPAKEMTLGSILNALGGRLFDDEFCARHAGESGICTHETDCAIRGLWQRVQSAVDREVSRMTLADLLGESVALADRSHLAGLPMAGAGASGKDL